MFTEDFHNSSLSGEVTTVGIFIEVLSHPDLLASLVDPAEFI